jgi:hypothetical protein
MRPDFVRGDIVIGRKVFRSLARCGDRESCSTGPVHHLGHERRLVAIGHRVNDPALSCLSGEEGTCQDVRLHIDHNDVLAGLDGRQCMPDSRFGMTGGFDHDLHIARRAGLRSVGGEARAGNPLLIPAHGPAGLTCPIRIEVGDHGNLEPGDGRHLGEEHRAEFAGADERHANGAACIEPLAEQC